MQSAKYHEKEVLQYMVSINQMSEHPLADATLKYGKEQGVELLKVNNFNSVTGKGVVGTIDDKKVALGNEKLMEEIKAVLPNELLEDVKTQQKSGKTVSFLSVDAIAIGYVVISDKIKASSKKAIAELQSKGIEVIMLTGDNYNTAKAVATELYLNEFKAGLLPQDKLAEVELLQSKGKKVAVAGDGINDAPALAKATLGISLSSASQIAMQSADVILLHHGLKNLPQALGLGKHTYITIKQNLFWAFFYNIVAIPVAAFGFLTPTFSALTMALSDVVLALNSIRLFVKKVY